MATLLSAWADNPITLAQTLSNAAWAGAGQMVIPGGYLWVKNDANYLYAALDLVSETVNDLVDKDSFGFAFDRDRNGNITPNYDYLYGPMPGNPNKMCHQLTLAPAEWTFVIPETATGGTCQRAFEASPHSATNHRIWKMIIPLADINVTLNGNNLPPYAKFGINIYATTPAMQQSTPADAIVSSANFHTLFFSRSPAVPAALAGPVIGCVGLIPTTKITAAGLATTDPGYRVWALNSAFGGTIDLIGNTVQMNILWASGVRKYKILHRAGNAGAFTDYRSSWYNYVWNGTTYEYDMFSADGSNFYQMPDPGKDYSIKELLVEFDSNNLAKGLHQFEAVFYNAANQVVITPNQILSLYIDNTLPTVRIDSITHGGVQVQPCDIVLMNNAADGIVFTVDASDPDGNLGSFALSAGWGYGQSQTIFSEGYTAAMGVHWNGVTNFRIPAAGVWKPPTKCAYGFTLSATSRTTNGYNSIGYTSITEYITINM